MAATNSTANLELSQFVGTDKPDWLTDYNGDMLKIDGAYGAVSATAEEAAANAESAAASASQAAEDATEALSGISGAIDAAAAAQAAAEQATSVSTSALTVANGAAATAQSAAADATQALSVAQNAKVTAENAQAAAAQAATDAAASAADAASAAAIASGVNTRVSAIEACVPSNASASNKLATMADIGGGSIPAWADIPAGDKVEGTATATVADVLTELRTKIDYSKLTQNSLLLCYQFASGTGIKHIMRLMAKSANDVSFEGSYVNPDSNPATAEIRHVWMYDTSASRYYVWGNSGTVTDRKEQRASNEGFQYVAILY